MKIQIAECWELEHNTYEILFKKYNLFIFFYFNKFHTMHNGRIQYNNNFWMYSKIVCRTKRFHKLRQGYMKIIITMYSIYLYVCVQFKFLEQMAR